MFYGLLKTPTAADAFTGNLSKKEQKMGNSGTLAQEILTGFMEKRGLLPTPLASEGGKMSGSETENQMSMTELIRREHGQTSQLNPRFVLEMMGFPPDWTELPFQNGEMNPSNQPETP
jgi:hypothetical protein